MSTRVKESTLDRVLKIRDAAVQNFTPASIGSTCFIEENRPADSVLELTWQANVYRFRFGLLDFLFLVFGHFGLSWNSQTVVFKTHHAISAKGRRSLSLRRAFWGLILGSSMLGIIFGTILFLLELLLSLGKNDPENHLSSLAGLVVICMILVPWSRRMGLPKSMKAIGQWPIDLLKIKRIKFPKNPQR